MSISTYVNDLFVEGGLVVLVNRSMPALWLLALPIDCVLGEVEGVCMPISFRRWFYTNTGKTLVTVEQDSTEQLPSAELCELRQITATQAAEVPVSYSSDLLPV